ncbi:MAG: hypothetical protein NC342_00470 [Pseudoflavonifractor sp.]|nr:hypothetical protein [Pseudoflavonifractor sp.]
MKTKLNMLMLTLITMFACLSLSSCDKDNDPILGESAYVQLTSVETNCLDANGNSIASAAKNEWISANKADSQAKVLIGKTSLDRAEELFDQNISFMRSQCYDFCDGKNILPEGGYITYNFALIFGNAAVRHASIKITNDGVN